MKIRICVLLFSLMLASGPTPTTAAENKTTDEPEKIHSFGDIFLKGKFKALFRYSGQYRDSHLHLTQDAMVPHPDTSADKKQQYSAIGGYLGYETAPWFYTTIGATVYTGIPIGNNPDDRKGLSILLRVAYNNYETDYDFAAYKAVHGYEFDSATDDYFDFRLYFDYKF